MNTHDIFNDREDPFSTIKHDLSKVFHENNLGTYTNPSDIGFFDFGKAYHDPYTNNMDDHHQLNELDNQQPSRFQHGREDTANRPENFMAPSYSPMRFAHQNPSHFNHPNFNANGPRQPYHQEHALYGGYHHYPQNYGYHYDQHMMQPLHENPDNYLRHHNHEMMDNADPSLSLMLSNKTYPSGNHYAESNMRKQQTYGYPTYDHDHEEEIFHEYKTGPMMKNDMLRNPVGHGKPQMNGIGTLAMNPNDMDLKSTEPKRISGAIRYGSRPDPNPRKLSGKMDTFMDEDDGDDGDDGFGEGKGRSTRGLRILSLKVKEIVSQKKRTSYKEVAESLTYELRQKMTARSAKEESKDEQNVKRRVYDALNVLIAADVLRKEGKVVYCEESMTQVGAARKKVKEDKDKLHFELLEARKKNKQKVEFLNELIFKCLAIKNLIKTNKEKFEAERDSTQPKSRPSHVNATRIEVVQENPALKPKNEDVIRFPFIVLLSSSPENSMNLNMDTSQKQLAIESKKPFNIFGDIDVLLKMGLHYVPKEMFDHNIPHELQKFVPKYYLAELK